MSKIISQIPVVIAPVQKDGRHWRFHKDAVDAWIKDGIPPTQAYGKARPRKRR